MQVVYERCCGLDVPKKTVVACALLTGPDGTVQRTIRTFSTRTVELLALEDWLRGQAVEVVAMESTGSSGTRCLTCWRKDARLFWSMPSACCAVPGRKTDVRDSQWLADLLRHGLLKASFIPPKPIRELRELTRYRKTLVQERTQEVNRLQKLLESANIKLAAVASDVLGKSGRDMLEALIGGNNAQRCWRSWHAGCCAKRFPWCAKRWRGGSSRIMPSS
jgi:transposase